jgi:hypothetical protein
MANSTGDISLAGVGQDGRRFHWPINTGANIYSGTLVSQLSTGLLVATTTAGAGPAIGKATHTVLAATAGQRLLVETDRIYRLSNGLTTDAFSEGSALGSIAYAFDDHTVYDNDASGTLQPAGTFCGLDADGKVLVLVRERAATPRIQAGSGTFAAGVLTLAAGITVTADSKVFAIRKTEAGTDGDEIRVPTADRTVGGPGTGSLVFRSFLSGVAATSDTSTFDYLIVG